MNLAVDRRDAPVRLTPDLLPLVNLARIWSELEDPYSPVDVIQLMLEVVCSLEGDEKVRQVQLLICFACNKCTLINVHLSCIFCISFCFV